MLIMLSKRLRNAAKRLSLEWHRSAQNLVDLKTCCKMSISTLVLIQYLQNSALVQPRTNPPEFGTRALSFTFASPEVLHYVAGARGWAVKEPVPDRVREAREDYVQRFGREWWAMFKLANHEVHGRLRQLWEEAADARAERFDRRGTEPFEPFEPFEFFQNRNFP